MAAFVLDASATLSWCFADEATVATNAMLARLRTSDDDVVPAHWPAEVAKALLISARRRRISYADAVDCFKDLEDLPIRVDPSSMSRVREKVIPLAQQYNLTLYDAAYLKLAIREGLPLATLDDDLRKSARAAGVSLA